MLLQFSIQAIVLAANVVWRRSLQPALIRDAVVFPLNCEQDAYPIETIRLKGV